jgi:putative protease
MAWLRSIEIDFMAHARVSRPELLAPAGNWEALRAAVANGADAVYFGLSRHNARARAANFDPEELPTIIRYLHERAVRGYVTLNTLIFPDELPELANWIAQIAQAGVDAVIVQDLGLVRLIRELAPTLPIHASTQMTLTEPRGIALARQLGVERVVLARELSLPEIRSVVQATDTPVEVFVHGALCVAYSGQCLTSEALGGRSANRGQCAQACRLPYELIVDRQRRDLGDRAYLLSPQDLAGYDLIDSLIDAGVVSFKIEGRLKGGPYVAAACQTYRQAIDAKLQQRSFQLPRRAQLELAQTFSRGFTPGFLNGVNHQKLVEGRFPKARGIFVGTVDAVTRTGVVARLAEHLPDLLKPGDGVVFDLGRPEEQEPGGRLWTVQPMPEPHPDGLPRLRLGFEPGAVDLTQIPRHCRIWKTDDPALRKRLEATYAHNRPRHNHRLDLTLSGELGGRLTLRGRDDRGRTATVHWPGPLDPARKRPTSEQEIHEQLNRLGETPFYLNRLELQLPPDIMIPRSVLNDLRRQLVSSLVATTPHPIVRPNALSELRSQHPKTTTTAPDPRLTILVRTLEQLDTVLTWQPPAGLPRPAMVICDFEDLRRYKEAVPRAQAAGLPIALATLRVLKPGEEGFHAPILRAKPDAVLIRNLGSLNYFQEALPDTRLLGDFSLNVANDLTAAVLKSAGLERMVPSFDLNWEQFQSLVCHADPSWFEPVVHQHMPMFHMEHCVFAAFLSTGKDHRDCGRPCDRHQVALRDRVGAEFPVHPDTGCRNTVYNSIAQSAAEYIGRMLELGIRTFRIDLLREDPAQIAILLSRYTRILAGQEDGRTAWRELRAIHQLGVTRGTLQLI